MDDSIPRIRELLKEALSVLAKVETSEKGARTRRLSGVAVYRIEKVRGVLSLVETRPSQNHPFAVAKDTYMGIASALHGLGRPDFRELRGAVERDLGHTVPEYAIRVSLRCWLQSPPLLKRSMTRYIPTTPKSFVRDAALRWEKLATVKKSAAD